MIPRTEYVLAEDGVHVAYQVFGDGGLDLVFVNRMAATIGCMWEIPDFARFLRRLGTMARVIALDSRGIGLSDRRLPARATLALEQRMTDIRAVMDAARSQRASLYRGREINTAGDGFLATFDGPAWAVRCAAAITQALSDLGISICVGVHTGEVEVIGDAISGIAVHVGARIAALPADAVPAAALGADMTAVTGRGLSSVRL